MALLRVYLWDPKLNYAISQWLLTVNADWNGQGNPALDMGWQTTYGLMARRGMTSGWHNLWAMHTMEVVSILADNL